MTLKEWLGNIPNFENSETPEELKEYSKILNILHFFLVHKSKAKRSRLDGDIQSALNWESRCEDFYKQLPDWVKW